MSKNLTYYSSTFNFKGKQVTTTTINYEHHIYHILLIVFLMSPPIYLNSKHDNGASPRLFSIT